MRVPEGWYTDRLAAAAAQLRAALGQQGAAVLAQDSGLTGRPPHRLGSDGQFRERFRDQVWHGEQSLEWTLPQTTGDFCRLSKILGRHYGKKAQLPASSHVIVAALRSTMRGHHGECTAERYQSLLGRCGASGRDDASSVASQYVMCRPQPRRRPTADSGGIALAYHANIITIIECRALDAWRRMPDRPE